MSVPPSLSLSFAHVHNHTRTLRNKTVWLLIVKSPLLSTLFSQTGYMVIAKQTSKSALYSNSLNFSTVRRFLSKLIVKHGCISVHRVINFMSSLLAFVIVDFLLLSLINMFGWRTSSIRHDLYFQHLL